MNPKRVAPVLGVDEISPEFAEVLREIVRRMLDAGVRVVLARESADRLSVSAASRNVEFHPWRDLLGAIFGGPQHPAFRDPEEDRAVAWPDGFVVAQTPDSLAYLALCESLRRVCVGRVNPFPVAVVSSPADVSYAVKKAVEGNFGEMPCLTAFDALWPDVPYLVLAHLQNSVPEPSVSVLA